jgi:Family of unknown function (DUF6011)
MTITSNPQRPSKWKWVRHNDAVLFDVGILPDGTLHNPNGYPDDDVRTAVLAADQRRQERRSRGAVRAAETRSRRRERKAYDAAARLVAGLKTGPRSHCYVCGRGLADDQSIQRGIGSECWQGVLTTMARIRTTEPTP